MLRKFGFMKLGDAKKNSVLSKLGYRQDSF